jgi:hypothetical protein
MGVGVDISMVEPKYKQPKQKLLSKYLRFSIFAFVLHFQPSPFRYCWAFKRQASKQALQLEIRPLYVVVDGDTISEK